MLPLKKNQIQTYNNIAIIVAAGEGSRFSQEIIKQYAKISDQTLLAMVVRSFITHPQIDGTIVVIDPSHLELYLEATKEFDLLPYVNGGRRRQDSVRNALECLAKYKPRNVLIHDAARVFVDHDIISKVIDGLDNCEAVVPAVKLSDTLKYVTDAAVIKTLPRESLFLAQTPQGFDYGLIRKLHRRYKSLSFTDDASIVEYARGKVKVVESNIINFKITTKEDLNLAKLIARGME